LRVDGRDDFFADVFLADNRGQSLQAFDKFAIGRGNEDVAGDNTAA